MNTQKRAVIDGTGDREYAKGFAETREIQRSFFSSECSECVFYGVNFILLHKWPCLRTLVETIRNEQVLLFFKNSFFIFKLFEIYKKGKNSV